MGIKPPKGYSSWDEYRKALYQKRGMMNVIRNKNGKIISVSRNLRGIRRAVGTVGRRVKHVSVNRLFPQFGGKLLILFENGDNFECNYASYTVLCNHVLNWLNLYGAPLSINGVDSGVVTRYNHRLLTERGY